MFRAIFCLSSRGQIVLIQHLISSLSVSDRPVHRLRKNLTFVWPAVSLFSLSTASNNSENSQSLRSLATIQFTVFVTVYVTSFTFKPLVLGASRYSIQWRLKEEHFLSSYFNLFFNLLNPSRFITYHQVYHSKILHVSRFALSVL